MKKSMWIINISLFKFFSHVTCNFLTCHLWTCQEPTTGRRARAPACYWFDFFFFFSPPSSSLALFLLFSPLSSRHTSLFLRQLLLSFWSPLFFSSLFFFTAGRPSLSLPLCSTTPSSHAVRTPLCFAQRTPLCLYLSRMPASSTQAPRIPAVSFQATQPASSHLYVYYCCFILFYFYFYFLSYWGFNFFCLDFFSVEFATLKIVERSLYIYIHTHTHEVLKIYFKLLLLLFLCG